jgi:hypothetical protein
MGKLLFQALVLRETRRITAFGFGSILSHALILGQLRPRIGVVKQLAVRTGRLRRSLAVHIRPIDLVVFQEPSALEVPGNLVLEGASRLDAFSAYPVPT